MTWRAVALVACVASAATVDLPAQPAATLVDQAYAAAYGLDYPDAIALLHKALSVSPDDPDAHRAMAVVSWLRIGFLRGSVTVDDYLGSVSKPNVDLTPPPKEDAQRFQRHIARALELSEALLRARPNDPEAHFKVGSAVGIQASYGATVEGRVLGSFRAARRAYDEHERVMKLDPRRRDAGLIVGTYRYVVSALSLPIRLMAYVAGFGGDKALGLKMIEDAAASGGQTAVEARFALLLLYNREGRYGDAMRVTRELQQRFPRNRLLWLEGGATLIRAGQFADADTMLSRGLEMLAADRRERMFGEEALWHYKRAVARVRLGRTESAREDLDIVFSRPARDWVRGRSHAELGQLYAKAGDREQARREYRLAIESAVRGNDRVGEREAEALMRQLR